MQDRGCLAWCLPLLQMPGQTDTPQREAERTYGSMNGVNDSMLNESETHYFSAAQIKNGHLRPFGCRNLIFVTGHVSF